MDVIEMRRASFPYGCKASVETRSTVSLTVQAKVASRTSSDCHPFFTESVSIGSLKRIVISLSFEFP